MKVVGIVFVGLTLVMPRVLAMEALRSTLFANTDLLYRDAQPLVGAAEDEDADFNYFARSGTRGRDGLGAHPTSPEGPGNVSY